MAAGSYWLVILTMLFTKLSLFGLTEGLLRMTIKDACEGYWDIIMLDVLTGLIVRAGPYWLVILTKLFPWLSLFG